MPVFGDWTCKSVLLECGLYSNDCYEFQRPKQTSNRRRTDPVITMSTIYEHILNEMREMPNVSEIKLKEKHSEIIVTIGTMLPNLFSVR